jgi:hypothetical protein
MATPILRRCTVGLLLLAQGPLGCEDPPPPPPADPSLVDLAGWERVDAVSEDVFGAERPADLVCDELLGITTELFGAEPVLEIDTDFCDYATVRQPSQRALAPGDIVAIRMWHYPLSTPAPAQAHLALAIDGAVVWEAFVPSPAAGAYVEDELVIDRALPAGTELQLHVHNHGANTYDLLALEVVDGDAERSAAW